MSEKRYKIICSLPNASTEINGIKFEEDAGELVALDVTENEAKRFESIPGYELIPIGGQLSGKTENLDDDEGEHNSVLSALKTMNVTDIKEFLKVQPDAWNPVLTLEEQRTETRQGVMDAVKSAKASLKDCPESKQKSKSNSND